MRVSERVGPVERAGGAAPGAGPGGAAAGGVGPGGSGAGGDGSGPVGGSGSGTGGALTVHATSAGVASSFPTPSLAQTFRVWGPTARALAVYGELHGAGSPESS